MNKQRGVIAAGHELTAQAAEVLLREGGNAFDAALAGLAAACVVEPVLCSLGGGGFLLARPNAGRAIAYDFFVQTPSARRATSQLDFYPILADFGTTKQEFHIGRGSVAVPGLVRGLFEVHRDLGKAPLREVLAPAVKYAVDGVTVNSFQAYFFQIIQAIYTATPETRANYSSLERPGHLPEAGETHRQPALADALEALSHEGADLFYRGEIAQTIIGAMRDGGHLTGDDLAGYRVERRAPLTSDYHGARLMTNPPPSSGGLLIAFALKLVDELGLPGDAFGSVSHIEGLARVMKLTNEARLDACVAGAAGAPDVSMLDPGYLADYQGQVAGRAKARRGTTHISVIDADDNIAALSVSNGEGCGYVVPGTGIMLNNMLGEEDLNPGGFHHWPIDERMTSMMAPSVVLGPGRRVTATGSGGSNRIRTAILQLLVNLIDFGMGVEDAVVAPRIHFEDGLLSLEGGFSDKQLASVLRAFPSHQTWDERNMFFGGAHTAGHDLDGFHGAGDPRRGGVCIVIDGA